MIFSTKPYQLDAWLLADDAPRAGAREDEQPLEYHLNRHAQQCSACGSSSVWSEVTLVSFHRQRKARIVRAAPVLEYNIPMRIHHHDPVVVPACAECAALAHFALRHLPIPVAPGGTPSTCVPFGWREGTKPKSPTTTTRQKTVVTDDDLLA